MCCGRKRAALRGPASFTTPSVTRTFTAEAVIASPAPTAVRVSTGSLARQTGPTVTLHYRGDLPRRVWGPVTGQAYDVSADQPRVAMDPSDAAALAHSEVFAPV